MVRLLLTSPHLVRSRILTLFIYGFIPSKTTKSPSETIRFLLETTRSATPPPNPNQIQPNRTRIELELFDLAETESVAFNQSRDSRCARSRAIERERCDSAKNMQRRKTEEEEEEETKRA
ncbi:hypothetical protein Syun_023043 [Stephania yunnanensis]|uniref:Uncharacterized protein n=1 Tax=Stephania yunnanensis TaxID=152371 RepID=A0AAP0FB04_9MAGN